MAQGSLAPLGARPLDLSYPLVLASLETGQTAVRTALREEIVRAGLGSSGCPGLLASLSPTGDSCTPPTVRASDQERRTCTVWCTRGGVPEGIG